MKLEHPLYALYKHYDATPQEKGDLYERLNKMASILGIEWGEFENLLSEKVDQATNELECRQAFNELLNAMSFKIQTKIEELAKSQELNMFEFVDLMKKL